jgi:hypothetical protein
VIALGIAASANAGVTFFQIAADPDGALDPSEFIYDATAGLTHGPGAIGNNLLTSPGMGGVVTGGLPGIANSPPGLVGFGPPYQILQDLTLNLSGFAPVGSATVAATSITQNLAGGSFSVFYDAGGTISPIVLLTGTTASALLTEQNTGVGSVLSGEVTYTGGLLAADLAAAGLTNTGTFSFALSGLNGTFGTVNVGQDVRLSGFDADGTGTFDANLIPEPTVALGAAAMLGFLGAGRSRRRA